MNPDSPPTGASAYLREARLTLLLAVPLIIGQVSQMALAIIDTVMIGELGTTEVAALSFSSAVFQVFFIVGVGVLTAVSVRVATARGQDDQETSRTIIASGFQLGLSLGLALALLGWALFPLLPRLGQPAEVIALAPPYLLIILSSMVPALAAMALKNASDALNRPWPAFFIFCGGVVLNVPLNAVLIHGWGPIPALGLTGAGWATFISRVLILGAMILWFARSKMLAGWVPRHLLRSVGKGPRKSLLKIGIPTSVHLVAEVGAFSAAGFLCGLFGEVALAAHQVALTTAGTAFMVPLGIALALTVRIGHQAEKDDALLKRRIALTGWALTLLVTSIGFVVFLTLGHHIAGLYIDTSTDAAAPQVIALAASLLIIVGVFQYVDGLQVASTGLLRGLSDVTVPAWIAFICYWIIGLPVGYGLASWGGLGARGVWIGLAVGLTIAAIALSRRVWKMLR